MGRGPERTETRIRGRTFLPRLVPGVAAGGAAPASGGGGHRVESRGGRGRWWRPALAREPQLAVLFLVLDHVGQVAEEVLAVAAYQNIRQIWGGGRPSMLKQNVPLPSACVL